LGIVYLLLPASLLLAAVFVLAFRWAARAGQFDELDTEASRILFDNRDGARERDKGR